MEEETGARNIRDILPLGIYEEFRPWYKPEYDTLHMQSYCYFYTIDKERAEPRFEDYEIANGMQVVWINILEAIEHNKEVIANSPKKVCPLSGKPGCWNGLRRTIPRKIQTLQGHACPYSVKCHDSASFF